MFRKNSYPSLFFGTKILFRDGQIKFHLGGEQMFTQKGEKLISDWFERYQDQYMIANPGSNMNDCERGFLKEIAWALSESRMMRNDLFVEVITKSDWDQIEEIR
jgi:hypothetical protein